MFISAFDSFVNTVRKLILLLQLCTIVFITNVLPWLFYSPFSHSWVFLVPEPQISRHLSDTNLCQLVHVQRVCPHVFTSALVFDSRVNRGGSF